MKPLISKLQKLANLESAYRFPNFIPWTKIQRYTCSQLICRFQGGRGRCHGLRRRRLVAPLDGRVDADGDIATAALDRQETAEIGTGIILMTFKKILLVFEPPGHISY